MILIIDNKFDPGPVNWICAADAEAGNPRLASVVKVFDLTPSISVVPNAAAPGDTVTVFAYDFPDPGAAFTFRGIGDGARVVLFAESTGEAIDQAGSASATVTLPAEIPNSMLGCTVFLAVKWGNLTKTARITITDPSEASTTLGKPCNLTAAPGTQTGTVDLQWVPPVGAQYHFVVWIPSGITDPDLVTVKPVSAEGRATVTGLNQATPYWFVVMAGKWGWSPSYEPDPKQSPLSGWVMATSSP